jgi:copper chaperone
MNQDTETLLVVEGMTCGSCVRHVRAALDEVDGVRAVDVNLAKGQVTVQHEANASVGQMVDALRDAGYDSAPNAGA